MMKRKARIILFTVVFLTTYWSCTDEPDTVKQPRFFTSDIDLFWKVFDENTGYKSTVFKSNYVGHGTIGLNDFDDYKDICPELQWKLNQPSYLNYYKAIRNNTNDLQTEIEVCRQGYTAFEAIYPDFSTTDIYFLVGAMTAGGKKSEHGLLIAVEFFTKTDDSQVAQLNDWYRSVIKEKPYIPSVVIHELVHFQQHFYPKNMGYNTLLEQSVMEGMADYITKYVLGDEPFFNQHLHNFGDSREQELWLQFANDKDKNFETTEWLYTGRTTSQGYPADMGYFVGYKIIEAYSATFENPDEAISAMLTNPNYYDLFEKSGYAQKFE